MAESDRRNGETTTRARKTTERLSVAELVERNKKNTRAPRPDTRRGSTSDTPGAETSSPRRGSARDARRVPRTDESRSSARGRGTATGASSSRAARRVADAQQNQERARRTQPFEARDATDDSVNAAGSERSSRLRPDPLRRAGDVRRTVRTPKSSHPVPPAQPAAPAAPEQPKQAPKQASAEQPDARKRAPRALDEDLYGN